MHPFDRPADRRADHQFLAYVLLSGKFQFFLADVQLAGLDELSGRLPAEDHQRGAGLHPRPLSNEGAFDGPLGKTPDDGFSAESVNPLFPDDRQPPFPGQEGQVHLLAGLPQAGIVGFDLRQEYEVGAAGDGRTVEHGNPPQPVAVELRRSDLDLLTYLHPFNLVRHQFRDDHHPRVVHQAGDGGARGYRTAAFDMQFGHPPGDGGGDGNARARLHLGNPVRRHPEQARQLETQALDLKLEVGHLVADLVIPKGDHYLAGLYHLPPFDEHLLHEPLHRHFKVAEEDGLKMADPLHRNPHRTSPDLGRGEYGLLPSLRGGEHLPEDPAASLKQHCGNQDGNQ